MTKSIRNKIRSAFNVVNGLTIVVAAIAVIALAVVVHKANQALQVGARLNSIGLEIQAGNLTARKLEKDFRLSIRALGVEGAKQRYAAGVPEALAQIDRLASQGSAIAPDATDRARFHSIRALARTYASGFADVVAALERRGHVDSGAEGEFRKAAHQIEQDFKGQDKLQIALLTLRRSEKDYLLRGDRKYIDQTFQNVQAFKSASAASRSSAAQRPSASDLANAYQAAFSVLLEADREVAAKESICNEAAQRMEAVSNAAAEAGMKTSRQSLDASSIAAWTSIVLVVLISLAAIGAGFAYGSRISGHIIDPVTHLTEVARTVSMGDLSLRVQRTCDDEIGDLEDSLARLVTAVKFFKAESEEAAMVPGGAK